MLKTTLFTLLICLSFAASAQVVGPSQNPEETLNQLKTAKHDTLRVKGLQSLLQYYIQKRGDLKVNLDSALNYGKQAKFLADSLHRTDLKDQTLMWIGETYLKFLDYDKAKAAYLEAANDYHDAGQKKKEANVFYVLTAKSIFYRSLRPELVTFAKKSLAIATQSGDMDGIMSGHLITGSLYHNLGNTDSAGVHLLKALPIAKSIGGENAYKVYLTLSAFYRVQGDNAKALTYGLATLQNLRERHVPLTSNKYAYITIEIGRIYESYDGKQSLKYYNEAMNYALVNKNEGGIVQFYEALQGWVNMMCEIDAKKALSVANGYFRKYPPVSNAEQARIASIRALCYDALHENKLAEKNYLKTVELYKDDPLLLPEAKAALARFYSATKQFKKTANFLGDTLHKVGGLVIMDKVMEEYQRYQLDSAKGNYVSALNHYRRYKALNDTVYSTAKSRQIADLEIQYETKEKEQAIKLLKSESLNQRTDLQRLKLQKNITLGGIGVLLLISGLVIYGYSQKQRSNRLLTEQKNEIDKKNESLENLNITQQKLLTEKDWLLKEVHHRVKNNLQIVMSLLNTQSAYLQNNAALDAIRESQNRVQSISLIHQKLYSSTNVASIDIAAYVADLVNYLRDCFDTAKRAIRFNQVIEPIKIDLAQAVPVGLILNEAVTNAIKYAFTEKGGEIIIGMQVIAQDIILLTIADNGKGLPPDFDIRTANSLGMEMMKALSKQLGGMFEIKSKAGTVITIEFQLEKIFSGSQSESLIIDK